MITKERMAELIKQGATIYKIRDNMIIDYQLCNYNYLKDNILIYENVITNYCRSWIGNVDDFFETEEEAQWELEMTATRTETLKLPTWEEFYNSGKSVVFRDVYGDIQELHQFNREIFVNTEYCGFLTKENYTKACKLCLKLFKGEEV